MDKSYLQKDRPSKAVLEKMNAYWRATNYLSAIQLYLLDNPLLKKPLTKKDIKQRIVGPWGTAPGQNFVYVHLNRAIKKFDLNMILLSGPGHGGHFWTANTYLEGTYSEFYPQVSQDEKGLKKFCKQFCFPFGVSSHVAPEMPGSIHEGGELGYVLGHAFGAVFDNPDLIATAIVGDGEAETGPLATSWHSNKFLNPITDGAVLPILHLNGYKVFNPTVLARISHEELEDFFKGCGWKPYFVEGSQPIEMHAKMADTVNKVIKEIKNLQKIARTTNNAARPIWPMIVLCSPKGWTCPKEVDGLKIEDSHNAYHVPYSMKEQSHILELETWLKSYKPEELFDENGKFLEELEELAPTGAMRLGSNPNANGGLFLKELDLPDFKEYAVDVKTAGDRHNQDTTVLSKFIRDIIKRNPNNFRIFSPDEMVSNRMGAVYETTNNVLNAEIYPSDESIARQGRVMDAYLSEHMCEGWLEGYLLTGRHGTFITYAAFVRVVDSMISQHAKWLKMAKELPWRKDIASLNIVLTSHAWQQDHNGYSHQDPGLLDHLANKRGEIIRMYLPPDANCLLACYDHCIRSKNYINAIVTSKIPSYQWLNIEEAIKHCKNGLGVWQWASNDKGNPDVVIACAGDVITLETLAAVSILKENLPSLKIKFINVVNLMKLATPETHPHGLIDEEYNELFTTDKPIIFNYHGYPSLIHELTWSRQNRNINVCGYREEGRISTPFDIRVQNKVDRFNFVKLILSKIPQTKKVKDLDKKMDEILKKHNKYIAKYGIDLPEVREWSWK
ncbi:MAG: phosphoketolase family protein [Clostridia bacterium]|nr:phosphoketolase family protein [Clostridia bacterium]